MSLLPPQITRTIEEFSKLPGIGPKSAERLVFHLLRSSRANPDALGVGIDEGTAFLVSDDRFGEVVGASTVMVLDAKARSGALVLYLLGHGQRFDLRKRARVGSAR